MRWHQTSSASRVIECAFQRGFAAVIGRCNMAPRTRRSSHQPDANKNDTVEASSLPSIFLAPTVLTASQRPAKKRRTRTRTGALSESLEPTAGSSKSQWTTYRVSQIPNTYDAISFHNALRISLQLESHTTLTIHSFASNRSQQRIAARQ